MVAGPGERRAPLRPFTIGDGMIIVAAIALGMALAQTIVGDVRGDLIDRVTTAARQCTFYLLALTIGHLAIRLRRPCPKRGALMVQPGTSAAVAALVVVAIGATGWALCVARGAPTTPVPGVSQFWSENWGRPGLGALAAWVGLALGGRLRPEPTWVDRAGRGIGALWIVSLAFSWDLGRWAMISLARFFNDAP